MSRARDVAKQGGLTLLIPSSVSYTGGTAPTVSANGTIAFSGNTTVTLNGIFSAQYDNYQIVFNGMKFATASDTSLKLGAISSNYYWSQLMLTNYGSSTITSAFGNASSSWNSGIIGDPTNGGGGIVWIQNPFNSLSKTYNTVGVDARTTANGGGGPRHTSGWLNDTTSCTSLTVFGSFNINSGTMRVYGLNNG